ncbi:MAG: pentapeptide repeat-containing protein [bacterium]|nr:pentapeptide repeat-containing protein [bacterium]
MLDQYGNHTRANLLNANLADANLSHVDFSGASLAATTLERTRLKGAVFSGAKLRKLRCHLTRSRGTNHILVPGWPASSGIIRGSL